MTSFPNSVWDGDSGNRDSDEGKQSSPDHRDWARVIAEIAAIQEKLIGHVHDLIGSLSIYPGLSVDEAGDPALHKTRIVFENVIMVITDAGAAGAHGKIKLYTFADEHSDIFTVHLKLNIAAGSGGIKNNAVLDIGIGSSEVSTANETLSLTEQNILAKDDVTLTGGTSTTDTKTFTFFDMEGNDEIFLNIAIENASCTGDDTLTFSGTLVLLWSNQH